MTTRKKGVVKAVKTPVDGKTTKVLALHKTAEGKDGTDVNQNAHFPVVGLGASAGGLAAFEAFFSGMPADVDPFMAFVLVQHLAPDHKSILTDLIRRVTRMAVFEVEDGMVVQPNCVYIIPPNRDMAYLGGSLHLLEPTSPHGLRLPIDYFFRSLAQDQCEQAIAIVLSGTGSDGTLGIRAIKAAGGMAIAQLPTTTEFDGMPRSAINTGLIDYELPPVDMPAQLISYASHAFVKLPQLTATDTPKINNALKRVFVLLRSQTGHDFSEYKPSTIFRRIERRMALHQIETVDQYVKFLQQSSAEVELLFLDLLIGVTSFFRDPGCFRALEDEIIPVLFANKPGGSTIRIWSPGCSTGEEAYSIAMLLQEHMERLKTNYTIQFFATDIDRRAITTARTGIYPASIANDLTPERLTRFFTAQPNNSSLCINKDLRDMMVFSEQDMIKDPPFSKLDLISCRNLLIYLSAELQKKLVPLFHYALKPNGILFLGSSEGVGEFNELFTVINRRAKLFQRKEDSQNKRRRHPDQILPNLTATDPAPPLTSKNKKLPLRELTEQALLQQMAQVAALVNSQGDILYLHGRTGLYLEPIPGEASINNILKMAREGLGQDLTMALHKAAGLKEIVRIRGLNVKINGHTILCNLSVGPVTMPEPSLAPLFLVIMEEALAPEPLSPVVLPTSSTSPENTLESSQIAALKDQLRTRSDYLKSTHEELETTNEELKSSNEEMQSVNEELQSTNEELETSKEELQSVNEELTTVNSELQTHVLQLSRANNDMNNLLAGTGIGTVFVDFQLRIMRFTPAASIIINLILSDIGRPVGHIVSNLVGYNSLVADIQAVLDTLIPKDLEVQTTAAKWYVMHIQPYRTLENVIEGAVISFVDITETVQLRSNLKKVNNQLRLAVVVNDASDAITAQDLEGHILAWNPAAERLYGWNENEALLMNARERIPMQQQVEALTQLQKLSQGQILESFRAQRLTKDGALVPVTIVATALLDEAGKMYAVATTERMSGATVKPIDTDVL